MRIHGHSLTLAGALCLLVAGCRAPQVPETLHAFDGSAVPAGAAGDEILRGHAILADTYDSLHDYVTSTLRCTSCHLDDGRRSSAMPLTAAAVHFPRYSARSGATETLQDRINECVRRSLAGRALPDSSSAMRDMVSYLTWLSHGAPAGTPPPDAGLALAAATAADTAHGGDVAAGNLIYFKTCVRCHAADGSGTPGGPPVWGPQSFSIGAGMARRRTATAFIQHNMPYNQPGALSDAEAAAVAAYITSQPRPDLVGKENDWPRGDAPVDVAYATRAGRPLP
ncbi:MAG TPA: c-type cytochrome [Gemmatimonadales bacterium]|jgi:thiosulfate dehydrogenase|nr:c-type cytochrome [Gemmatimonadales bacterium]